MGSYTAKPLITTCCFSFSFLLIFLVRVDTFLPSHARLPSEKYASAKFGPHLFLGAEHLTVLFISGLYTSAYKVEYGQAG